MQNQSKIRDLKWQYLMEEDQANELVSGDGLKQGMKFY